MIILVCDACHKAQHAGLLQTTALVDMQLGEGWACGGTDQFLSSLVAINAEAHAAALGLGRYC